MSDDPDLRARIHRALSDMPDRAAPPVDDVARRAGKHRARRAALGATLVVGLAAGVVAPLAVMSSVGKGGTVVGGGTAATALPDVGLVRCDRDTTTVATPVVRPQPDGVHFRVDNTSGRPLSFQIENVGGRNAPAGVHDLEDGAMTIPPGSIRVRCFDSRLDDGIKEGYVPMTIEDPQGLWVPDEVQCTYWVVGITDYVAGARGGPDPAEVARRAVKPFLQPGDQVRHAGYPLDDSPVLVVVRDGRVFASVEVVSDGHGGWLASVTTRCTPPPQPLDVVSVTCNERGTHVPTEPVMRQADGVHFKIDNPQPGAVTLEVEGYGSSSSPPGYRVLTYPGTGEPAWPIPAGTIRVRCTGSGVPVSKKNDGWHEIVITDSGSG